jgi:hypothetical protein
MLAKSWAALKFTKRALDQNVDASSLEVAEAALVALGTSREASAEQVRRFRAHDEATLAVQASVKDDETKLIATARASAQQLESLFEADTN